VQWVGISAGLEMVFAGIMAYIALATAEKHIHGN
jgi:hypothetical protein